MREIYIHIGIHKTASTFLQRQIFPNWPGVSYLNTWKILPDLVRNNIGNKILLSNECFSGVPWYNEGKSWKEERINCFDTLSKLFPGAKIIIFLRKPWFLILSFYKQYLHEGGAKKFDKFFNFNKQSVIKPDELYLKDLIIEVEERFKKEILLISFETFKKNKGKVFKKLASFMDTAEPTFSEEVLNRRPNESVKYFPAKMLQFMNSISYSDMNPNGHLHLNNYYFKKFDLDPRGLCQKRLNKFFCKELKLDNEIFNQLKKRYKDDWHYVQSRLN